MKLENPSGIITNYGYENDTPEPDRRDRAADGRRRRRARGAEDGAGQEHVPRVQTQEPGRRPTPSYDYGTHFLYQGHEGGASVNGKKQSLHHADQPRRGRGSSRDAARDQDTSGNPLQTIDGSTWDPLAAAAPLHDREPERTDLLGDGVVSVDGRGRLGRARPRRLRRHPERLATATSGSSRTSAARSRPARRRRRSRTASSIATSRRTPATSSTGSCRSLQVRERGKQPDHGRVADRAQRTRPGRAAHATARSSRPSG